MKATAQNCTMATEGLRSLVGGNGWDYCVLWKLSQDQRFLEWMGCCCCGSSDQVSVVNGGALFPGATAAARKSQCRDAVVQHPRTRACDALSDFPSSLPLDSSLGIYAQVLISNQPAWLTVKASNCTSSVDDAAGERTRVLVPIPGGLLVELFVAKHITEDQNIINIIMSQCHNNAYEEISMGVVDQQQYSNPGIDGSDDYTWKNNLHPWNIPHMPTDHHGNFAWEEPMADDQSQLYTSPLNLLDGPGVKNGASGDHVFFDGSTASDLPNNSTVDHDRDTAAVAYQHSLMTTATGVDLSSMLATGSGKDNKESIKQETAARADSISDGSDEEEDARPTVGRNGKRHHSKNLVAERKRRKKLNDRLYALRALVPKITKMDRASILGDAIEYVMELEKQVKDLQEELEDDTNPEDDDDTKHIGSNCAKLDALNPKGVMSNNGMELDESPTKQPVHEQLHNDGDKGNQMEPQVEVRQVEGNDFFLKVFCEHKAGGFVRLMEAMSSLGLEVTNANVTTLGPLVLNVFRVEQKRENELLQVDQVRDSLLESARGAVAAWAEPGKFPANSGDYLHHDGHQNRGGDHHHQHLNPHNQFHYLSHQL